ncbi:bacillithiol biosynthesis cysteine-adding enzyme BshC [Natranaerofaba carboxydovora]|uniref:bacillithiol biosynthesis cysteine-adding enzyme BshC n=1 Tax=Natranaerofaba carboxydovora TaxID=2742683 RepID=UPI001F137D69|nr:bacillithiol biosynthesis cysteine-adding enzyme BshC [Natranaerofaba carboxydovora]UMZ73225.1 Putative cysteine ligase BshC [Natranaerofaba carboxydovora]
MQYTKFLYPEIFVDYLNFSDKIGNFYRLNPFEQDSFRSRYQEIVADYPLDRRRKLVNCLSAYNKEISDDPQVMKSIEKLKDPESVVVITGQQPGILSGPLYTIYKAITAIKLAKKQEKLLGKNVVPIFWLASEDHDIDEVNSINLRNLRGKIESFNLFTQKPNSSIGEVLLNDGATKLLNNIENFVCGTDLEDKPEYFDKWMKNYRDAAKKSNYLPEWTARILMSLFSKYGLLIVDPMLEEMREMSKDIFLKAVDFKNGVYGEVNKKENLVKKAGYKPVINLQKNHTGLFYNENNRKALIYEDEKYKTRDEEYSFSEKELKNIIENNPACFSPNVALRPALQDYIFPTLSYVAGPGEIGYFSQLKGVYESFDMKMPLIYPRERFVLIEPEMKEIMDNYDIKLEDIFFEWQAKKDKIINECSSIDIDDLFGDITQKIKEEHENLLLQLEQEFSKIRQVGEKNWNHMKKQLDYLKDKSKHYNKQNNKDLNNKLSKLKMNIYPNDKLQERFYSMGEYLLYYDDRVVTELLDKEVNPWNLQIISL